VLNRYQGLSDPGLGIYYGISPMPVAVFVAVIPSATKHPASIHHWFARWTDWAARAETKCSATITAWAS
jgi:hypothetical protein